MSNEIVMEANELMYGDYVRRKKNKEIVWVFEIDGERWVINKEDDGYCSERYIRINEIEPIPLTPEIMEKIGWINTAPGVWQQEFGDVAFYWDEDTHWGGLDVFRHQCDNMQLRIKIESFHELQHALRLCGIKKELTI